VEENLRASEEQYRDLFENANDLIQSIAPDGSILYVNQSWLEALEYNEKDIHELNIFDIIHPDSKRHCIEAFQQIIAGEEVEGVEALFVTKSGRTIIAEGNISCKLENGVPVATRGIFRDVTERKRVERMKDEFISTVSHELRTPLTSIHGSIDLINQGKVGELSPQAEGLLKIAGRNSQRLRNLIDDLLDMQKIETGNIDFKMEPLKLAPLLERMIEDNKSFADQFNVDFVMDDILPDIKVDADKDRLAQVLNNLFSNAAKFSNPESKVQISISRHNGTARVSVKDHGPGIPDEFHDKIFMKFTQADSSRTRAKGGTGLGLNIAKSIVELHGGNIGFETELGVGTTFYFELPELKGKKRSNEK
jgi:PAS domain S-box-containing protein